jgi:DNA primase
MAGRIPKRFIDDLLTRTDIVELIDERVPLKKAGKDHKACCPFHDEETPSFTVSSDKQFYHCFGCGAHGTAIGFLMEYDHLSFPEAVEELARRAGVEIPREAGYTAPTPPVGPDLLELLREAARFYKNQLREHPESPRAIDYLKGRGISGEIARDFELGLAPDGWDNLLRALGRDGEGSPTRSASSSLHKDIREALVTAGLAVKKEGGGYYDRFRDRVMFPIHDHRGRIVGFGGRVIDKGEPKYLNSPETPLFHKGRELYGLFRARDAIKRENRVLVVEGYMDVVMLAQYGIDFAVATLGTATTREHLERLYRHAPEIVFCFDGDRAGREAAWRALETTLPVLRDGRQASFLFVPEGEDPDTLVQKEGTDAFRARLKTAKPLPDFLFESLVKQVDLNRLDGRARLVELARPHLAKVAPGALQQLMQDRLSELSRFDAGKLTTLVGTPLPSARRPTGYGAGPKGPPSVMQLAIAMLVQHPALAATVPPDWKLEDESLPGADLFRELLAPLRAAPGMTTARLIEHFSDSPHRPTLEKLAVMQHPVLEHDAAAEFPEVLTKLAREAVKFGTDRLLQKQRAEGLSAAEKAELSRLLATRKG